MGRLVVTSFLVLCMAAWLQAEEPQPVGYQASRIALYSGVAFDLGTTEAVKTPELNPVLGQDPARRIPIMISATIATDLLTRELKKSGHAKLATVLNFTVGSLHIGAGAWNLRIANNSGGLSH